MVAPISEDFQALFLNRDRFLELAVRIAVALPPDATDQAIVLDFPTVVAPVYSLVFHLGPRFSTENSLTTYSAPIGFNELVLGGGIEVSPVKAGKTWLGLKASYSAIHHQMGFEKDAAVEYSSELAKEMAGTIYSVWRHQLRVLGTVSF